MIYEKFLLFLKKQTNLKNKKAMLYPVIIFIILNIVFFTILLGFVHNSATGSVVYEEAYAKQIAFLINQAKPSTQIIMNFEEGFEVAKKKKFSPKVLSSDKKILVKLSSSGGYSFEYFSDYGVDFVLDKKNKNLIINVK